MESAMWKEENEWVSQYLGSRLKAKSRSSTCHLPSPLGSEGSKNGLTQENVWTVSQRGPNQVWDHEDLNRSMEA